MEEGRRLMRYWLFKSEPSTWSWADQLAKGAAGGEVIRRGRKLRVEHGNVVCGAGGVQEPA